MIEFKFADKDNNEVYCYKWLPDGDIKGIVQISHGMMERADRYERLAEFLNARSFAVYTNDHKGHGKTAGDIKNVGYAGKESMKLMLDDMKSLNDIIHEDYPELPVLLIGHSLGSYLVRWYLEVYGKDLDGVILSGTGQTPAPALWIGLMIANNDISRHGAMQKSKTLHQMIFGKYNKKLKLDRTECEWLSRDEDEVDKYINNPWCGTIFSAGFYRDFFKLLLHLQGAKHFTQTPKDVPILLLSGDRDPVGDMGRGVKMVYRSLLLTGHKSVDMKLYHQARHEILNETNRDEVMEDIALWFENIIE